MHQLTITIKADTTEKAVECIRSMAAQLTAKADELDELILLNEMAGGTGDAEE